MATVDSLEIELKSNAKDVASGFNTLSKSIDKLSGGTKSLNSNLQSIANSFKNFAKELNTIDTKGLDKVNHLMDNISKSASKGMGNISKLSNNINNNFDSNKIDKSKKSVDEFMASIKGLGKNQKFFGSGTQLEQEIASTKNKIEKVRVALEAYNQEGKSVETKGWRTAQRQLEQYSNYLDNLIAKQNTATKTIPSGIDTMVNKNADIDNYQSRMAEVSEEVRSWYSEVEAQIRGFGSKAIDAGYFDKLRDIVMQPQIDNEKMLAQMDSLSLQLHNEFQKEPYKPQVFVDLDKVKQQTEQSAKQISETIKNRLDFEPTKLGRGQKYTQEYITLSKEISKAEKELTRYLNTQEGMERLGVNQEGQRYKKVAMNIEQADAKLQLLYADMKNLQSTGKDIINPNQFDKVSDGASKAQGVMLSLSKALRAGGFGSAASTVQKLGADVGSLSGGMSQLGATAEGASGAMAGMSATIPIIGLILAAVTLLIKGFTSLAKAVVNVMKKIGSAIKGTVVKIKELISNILSIGTSGHQAHTVLGKFINKIVGLFKSRVLRQAITQAIQYIKDGFKALDAYSQSIGTPFHNNVVMIISDLKWLGKTIAAAFEPIINVAAPILDFLIDKLVTVINYINQFISALTGKSTWTKATKGASDYADATGGASKAQKDLNKQIREWDKLNVITNPNKDKGSGGSGASSGGGGGFTTEEVDNDVANFVKKMQDTWNTNADFTWLGNDIAKKVKEKLDNIPWDGIKKSAEKFGKALATTINGFVEFPGIAQTIGNAIAQGINTVVTTFDSFVTNIHGDSIGAFIGNLVGTALDNIEWDKYIHGMGQLGQKLADAVNALVKTDVLSKISKAFANVLKGAIEGAYKFVTGIKWDELGTKIGNSISEFFKKMNEVDKDGLTGFQKLGKTVSGLATGIMDMLSNALDSIEWDKVGQSVVDFLTSIDWLDVINKAVTLKSKISNALWELFKAAIKGIGQLNIDVSIKLLDKIKEKLTEAKEYLKDKAIDFAANFPKWSDVSKKISNIVTNLKKKFKIDFKLQIPSWSSIKSKFDSIINGIKNLFKLDLSFKSNAKTQTVSTSIAGSVIKKAIKKVTKKANGGIYSNGTWKQFAVGGFPSHGTQFVAGEHGAEVVGHINGRTEVLNQSQIAKVMASSMSTANAEQNAILKQQNELLLQILQKETGISYKDVFKATQQGAKEYKTINGVPAFT